MIEPLSHMLGKTGPVTPGDLDFSRFGGGNGSAELALLIYSVARYSGAKVLVEIGVSEGDTSVFLAKVAQLNGGMAYGIDMAPCEAVRERMASLDLLAHWTFIQGDSLSYEWPHDRLVDFCYVDGDHNSAHQTADMEVWGARMRPGGYMVTHDLHLAPQMEELRAKLLTGEILPGWHKVPLDYYRGGMLLQKPWNEGADDGPSTETASTPEATEDGRIDDD